MPEYWWVNHKQTFRQEIENQYLWSPKVNRGGARNRFYDNMRLANPGDLVLSYADQVIRYVGRVAEFAFTAPKPTEFGTTGSYWNDEGWLLPVYWTEIDPPIRPKSLLSVIAPILPERYSPIRPSSGDGNQGAYLANIPKAVFDAIVSGTTYDHVLLARGGANSLTFQVVKEQLDDAVERIISADPTLDSTTRDAVIQARRGQGAFRRNVEAIEPKCRLTGITNSSLLIASHIKPWRSCTTSGERLDRMNGLMLTPDADLLFDRGFITFDDSGEVRVSTRFDLQDLRRLGLAEPAWRQFGLSEAPVAWNARAFHPEQQSYLAYHRANVYIGETSH